MCQLAAVDAAVIASVDRGRIDLNESFTLKVMVDTAIDVEPDASALEQDFFVGSRSQLSNTSIVNGQITRSRTWSYVLMAKRAGNLEIPPIKIGNERSEPVPITVAPPSNAAPGEADIFVVTEADFTEGYVQAQILYTVKVYRAVATRQPRLSEPEIGGVDALVEVAGRRTQLRIDSERQKLQRCRAALCAVPAGKWCGRDIAGAFRSACMRNGRISGRKVFQSEPIVINVKPIPPPPEDYPNAAWLPAKSVTLSEEWSREPDSLPAGEPITRRLTVTALGQLSTQIPVIDLAVSDSVKVYPDKPELRVSAESGGILAARTDQYAMIGVRTGNVDMADLELPWWDIAEGAWKVARLPGRTIDILPSADALLPQVAPSVATTAAGDEGAPVVVHSEFWRRVAEVIGAVWVMTLLAWWWSGRPRQRRESVADEPPVHKQQSRLLREARKAAIDDRSASVKAALLDWGRLEWPGNAPRSIGELADRVTEPAATELSGCAETPTGRPRTPDGAAMHWRRPCGRLPSARNAREASIVDVLPPLMPSR